MAGVLLWEWNYHLSKQTQEKAGSQAVRVMLMKLPIYAEFSYLHMCM